MERLDKLLSELNIMSRSEAKKAVKNKEIKINGEIARSSDIKVDEEDEIIYNGELIKYQKYSYIMLNKPLGVVSATEDRLDKTIIDILPKEMVRKDLFPVGRLDKDTLGLLIITNDGISAHKRLSPKNHVEKEYYFKLEHSIKNESIRKLESGITLDDGLETKPCRVIMEGKDSGRIFLTEGKYHEVRRMFAYFSNKVIYLKRMSFGDIKLDEDLKEGESRYLTKEEIESFTR